MSRRAWLREYEIRPQVYGPFRPSFPATHCTAMTRSGRGCAEHRGLRAYVYGGVVVVRCTKHKPR